MRKAVPGSLELLDCHKRLPNVIGRKGITTWPVICNKVKKKDHSVDDLKKMTFDEMFYEVKKEDIGNIPHEIREKDNQHTLIKPEMYPESEEIMKKFGIEKTMRLLPHD